MMRRCSRFLGVLLSASILLGAVMAPAACADAQKALTTDFSALSIYDVENGTYTLGETGADVTVLVIGRVICGLTTGKMRSILGIFQQLGIQNGSVYLLDVDQSEDTVRGYAQSDFSQAHFAWSGNKGTYNNLFWEITRAYYGEPVNSATLPAICVLDGSCTPIYYVAGMWYDESVFAEVLAPYAASSSAPAFPEVEDIPASGTAAAVPQTVVVDGREVEFQCYAIMNSDGNGTNYIKLRDLAYELNGTQAQFQVDWDRESAAICVTTETGYIPNGSEMHTPFSEDRAYEAVTDPIVLNGEPVAVTAFALYDDAGAGYTYYKLRDLGQLLGFNVSYVDGRVVVNTGEPYSADQ